MNSFIEIKSVSKNYKQGTIAVPALRDVSLHIDRGDIYGIIGLSGAGKSTLIRSLSRLEKPTHGQILINGENISVLEGQPLRTFRKKLGMIFQHFNLLTSRTVAENIAYPMEVAAIAKNIQQDRIDELLGLVGLQDKRDSYPSQLSGGQKQRVGIARALANRPELLLCDEATSALDPRTTHEILDILKSVNKQLGVTIVLITHEMEVIKRICNKVAVMEDGLIVEEGAVSQTFAEPQHPTTQRFLESSVHEIPLTFYKTASPNRKLLRLRFTHQSAGEPIISQLIRNYQVEANILLGWIDNLQNVIIGTLIIELTGEPEGIQKALNYLTEKSVRYEVLENAT